MSQMRCYFQIDLQFLVQKRYKIWGNEIVAQYLIAQ